MGFKFKQFTIEDDACAMKVGTDSIMLGSWIHPLNAQHILDIGTGSGLLAIMLAQKSLRHCLIHGIDIEQAAIAQATDNAANSPWSKHLTFATTSLQKFSSEHLFDLIVSNPPYFAINLRANKSQPSHQRVNARQIIGLDHPTLLKGVSKHLATNGRFYCVLPKGLAQTFTAQANSVGLFCTKELLVQPKPQAPVSRVLLELGRSPKSKKSQSISIYEHTGGYSPEYVALCKDYYLNF